MNTFRQFLEIKFLEWQQGAGGRKTVQDFADYLGIKQQTVSSWWNNPNKTPQNENILKLAFKLGIEVYDVLGLPRPDPDLFYIQKNWDDFPPKKRRYVREVAEKYK